MTFEELIIREREKEYFKKLESFLKEEYRTKTIFPPKDEVFSMFSYCELNEVKVVIIGQDPYHEINQAHGLAFSVKQGNKLPKSLINIYKELYDDILVTRLTGELSDWARQGVFLINTVLTVEEGKANSHKNKGWEIFTSQVIKELDNDNNPKVFVLWGNQAFEYEKIISNPNHKIIKSAHPSPLSAYRGFFGSKPFSKINKFLIDNNLNPIDWS
jgi:uracil-DNA glycosylase